MNWMELLSTVTVSYYTAEPSVNIIILFPTAGISFSLSEIDFRAFEEPDSVMSVSVTKTGDEEVALANPVLFVVTPLTVDAALAQEIIPEFTNYPTRISEELSPSRAGIYS